MKLCEAHMQWYSGEECFLCRGVEIHNAECRRQAEAIAAARLEERASIVAWLRRVQTDMRADDAELVEIHAAAIERGDHEVQQ